MSAPRVLAVLQDALAHHQAGRLDEAERLYKNVVNADPGNANALNLLGTIAVSRNRNAEAEAFYRRAISANARMASAHFNLGNLLSVTGDHAGALAAYDRALEIEPQFADAHLNKGALLHKMDRLEEAAGAFGRVIVIAPRDARGHSNLAQCYKAQHRFAEAEESYARVLSLQPQQADAYLALAEICARDGRIAAAIGHTRAAIAIQPTPESHSNLGDLLRRAGDFKSALEAHRAALAARPNAPALLFNYGAALFGAASFDEAADAFRRVLVYDARFLSAYHGLAKIHEQSGDIDAAIAELERGLAIVPHDPDLVFQLALRQLTRGRMADGWKNYEARFHTSDRRQVKRPAPPPYWQGEDLAGKSILVWSEQGIGDEILYAGLLPDIIARARTCVVECEPRLAPVFARSFPQAQVRARGAAYAMDEGFDVQSPLASLGQYVRADFGAFPRHAGYLTPDARKAAALRARYRARAPDHLVVGISWRSNNEDIGVLKNTSLAQWQRLLRTPRVTFVNLQYGDCAAELAAAEKATGVSVVQDREIDSLRDMDGYFAQVAAMDLVISTSNTAVHVAGSLGVPTWLLLTGRTGALWYWFKDRNDVPWYPSVRILPQRTGGQIPLLRAWQDVLEGAAAELAGRLGLGG